MTKQTRAKPAHKPAPPKPAPRPRPMSEGAKRYAREDDLVDQMDAAAKAMERG